MFRPSSSALTVTLAALTIAATADDSVWKKHTIAEAKLGMINSAVAHDWDKDGHIDVLTSFDNRVVLLRGPD